MSEDYDLIREIALRDVETLKEKGKKYGSSWRKYEGVSAFMNTQRKADRFEEICRQYGYDVFKALSGESDKGETLLDTISDLRAYLLLIEGHYRSKVKPAFQGPADSHTYSVGKDGRIIDRIVSTDGRFVDDNTTGATMDAHGVWRPGK